MSEMKRKDQVIIIRVDQDDIPDMRLSVISKITKTKYYVKGFGKEIAFLKGEFERDFTSCKYIIWPDPPKEVVKIVKDAEEKRLQEATTFMNQSFSDLNKMLDN